ncbi:MAG: acyl-[acyl-carrier-protein]--UDP-N-acetylglucosamine O-acyltransferase [Planctomycetes bacterium RBG_13_62_9]|nr:MAG: acyl-[acyl-carrier-protein]--UDP-N-acetylglucosamine O-acyltransferase [Planctomycetes bacterium RBG_13_62_9]
MATIHPTAVVEKDVQLADDVVIGPYCVVGSGASIGPGTVLDTRVVVTGATKIGRDNRFYPNSVIGCCPQVLGLTPGMKMGELVIGDRNTIRENVTIHPSRHEGNITQIGSDILMMVGTHIGHDCTVEDKVVLSNYVQIAGHVKIERGAWISGLAASHQFVTIGQWCFVAGLAGLTRDVPPFLIVSGHYPPRVRGVNKRGMLRAGLNEQQQEQIYDAYKRLYRHSSGSTLLASAQELAQQDGLDENVRAMVEAIFRSTQHRFGRYRESLRA